MEPEGSSWVDKALGLLVFMVGLAAGARAHKMPQKCFLLLFLYLCCVALRTVPIVLRLEPNGKEMIKCFLSVDKLLSTCNLCGFIVKKWIWVPFWGVLYLVLDQEQHWFHFTQNPGRPKGIELGAFTDMRVAAQGNAATDKIVGSANTSWAYNTLLLLNQTTYILFLEKRFLIIRLITSAS